MNISDLKFSTTIIHHDYEEIAVEVEQYDSRGKLTVELPELMTRVSFSKEDLEALLVIINKCAVAFELLQGKNHV